MTTNLKTSIEQPLCELPNLAEVLARSSLSEKEKALITEFSEQGYLIIDDLVEDVEKIGDKIISNLKNKYGQKGYISDKNRMQDAWKHDENVRAIAASRKVLKILELLYGRKPIPFQTLNFPVGTQQMTHSDAIHFHSVPHRFMCGVWVALEDVDAKNGPLHYYPGSHKLPIYYYHDFGLTAINNNEEEIGKLYAQYEIKLKEVVEGTGLKRKHVTMKKGQALIWATNLLHGGNPILDKTRSRHSQVTHYYFENCLYYTPRLSQPYLGNYFWRQIYNIAEDKPVKSHYLGHPAEMRATTNTLPYIGEIKNLVNNHVAAGNVSYISKIRGKSGKELIKAVAHKVYSLAKR